MKKALLMTAVMCIAATPVLAKGSMHDDMFMKMDSNRDGKITRAEHDAFSRGKFAECDMNNDGVVTRDEMRAAMDRMKDEYGHDDRYHDRDRYSRSSRDYMGTVRDRGTVTPGNIGGSKDY